MKNISMAANDYFLINQLIVPSCKCQTIMDECPFNKVAGMTKKIRRESVNDIRLKKDAILI